MILVHKKWTRQTVTDAASPRARRVLPWVFTGGRTYYLSGRSWRRQPRSWTAGRRTGRGTEPGREGQEPATIHQGKPCHESGAAGQDGGRPQSGGGSGLCGWPGHPLKGSEHGRHGRRHPQEQVNWQQTGKRTEKGEGVCY